MVRCRRHAGRLPAHRALGKPDLTEPGRQPRISISECMQMPSQSGDGNRGGPWSGQVGPRPDLEELIRRAQDLVRRKLPQGGPRGPRMILIFGLILAALTVWSAFYTVPSDSVAVVQRFGKYLKEVQPGLNFKLPLGIDVATIVPVKRQLKQEFGFATPGATDPYQSSQDGSKGNADGDGRSERRARRMGGSVPHFRPDEVPVRRSRAEHDAACCLGIRHAGGGWRPHRRRGHHHRPSGDRSGSAGQNAGACPQNTRWGSASIRCS